jgi:hypothetical protein
MIDQNDTVDRLKVMLHQEVTHYSCPDYFAPDYVVRSAPKARSPTAAPSSPCQSTMDQCSELVSELSLNSSSKELASSPNDVKARLEASASIDSKTRGPSPIPTVMSGDVLLIPSWRAQMCTWAYTVSKTFGFSRTFVAIAFDYLDRYLAKELLQSWDVKITRQDFQLFSMTALYLAVKLNSDSNGTTDRLDLATLIDMSRGFFSLQDFEDTELDILEALDWRVSPPTANCFLTEMWALLKKNGSRINNFDWISTSRHLLEQSIVDAYFCSQRKSQLALAALVLAGKQCGVSKEESLHLFCDEINDIVDVNDADYQAVYKQLRGY